MRSDCSVSRPDTAATGMTTASSLYHSSSDKSFAYSIISSKFQSTGEVLLLPKVNARRSIRFDKNMTGPKIMAVRETAQWLISNNNRMTEDLSKECRRLDDSYLKWYRKHFNEKKDVLEKVSNLLSHAKKEKTERCRSYQSCYKTSSTPHSRMRKGTRSTTHQRSVFFATELPDVEVMDKDKVDKVAAGEGSEQKLDQETAGDTDTKTEVKEITSTSGDQFKSGCASNGGKLNRGTGSFEEIVMKNGDGKAKSVPKTPESAKSKAGNSVTPTAKTPKPKEVRIVMPAQETKN